MYQSVLVPFDGSDHSQEALRVACRLTSGPNAVVHLLNVAEVAPVQDGLDSWAGAAVLDEVRRNAEREGRELLERTGESLGKMEQAIRLHVLWGSPARVIVEEAERLGVDAIIMGSRGLSDLTGLAAGSVSHRVLHTARCHVICAH